MDNCNSKEFVGTLNDIQGVGDDATSEARTLPLLASSLQENQSLNENHVISIVKHWFLRLITA